MNETMDRTLAQNLMEFCENRACVYQFLSRCYEVEIDANSAKQITQGFSFSSDDEALNQAIEAMKQDLADASEAHLEQLAVVFNRVFFGMGPRTAQKAFPYESVYTSEQGIMMQEAYSAVAKVYREARLKKNPNFPEPEDHLAVECAFMAHLCTACILTLETADEVLAEKFLQAQQNFLRDHLLNWITPFVADAKQSAEEGFYWHLASFTEGFLRQDSTALEEVLGWADVVGSR